MSDSGLGSCQGVGEQIWAGLGVWGGFQGDELAFKAKPHPLGSLMRSCHAAIG